MTRSEAISLGQRARHALRIAQEGDSLPDRKKCSRPDCRRAGEYLDASEFSIVRRKLVDGSVRRYLKSGCRECERARKREWKAKKIEEEGREAWSERVKTWNSSRSKEYRKRYNREWWRRTHGKGIHTWKIYAHEIDTGAARISVDIDPIAGWLDTVADQFDLRAASLDIGKGESWVYDLMHRRQRTVLLEDVDDLLVRLGCQGRLSALYPLSEPVHESVHEGVHRASESQKPNPFID
jgi:hypothetical protein